MTLTAIASKEEITAVCHMKELSKCIYAWTICVLLCDFHKKVLNIQYRSSRYLR